jgi:hypothetical protein
MPKKKDSSKTGVDTKWVEVTPERFDDLLEAEEDLAWEKQKVEELYEGKQEIAVQLRCVRASRDWYKNAYHFAVGGYTVLFGIVLFYAVCTMSV